MIRSYLPSFINGDVCAILTNTSPQEPPHEPVHSVNISHAPGIHNCRHVRYPFTPLTPHVHLLIAQERPLLHLAGLHMRHGEQPLHGHRGHISEIEANTIRIERSGNCLLQRHRRVCAAGPPTGDKIRIPSRKSLHRFSP